MFWAILLQPNLSNNAWGSLFFSFVHRTSQNGIHIHPQDFSLYILHCLSFIYYMKRGDEWHWKITKSLITEESDARQYNITTVTFCSLCSLVSCTFCSLVFLAFFLSLFLSCSLCSSYWGVESKCSCIFRWFGQIFFLYNHRHSCVNVKTG